MKNRMPMNYWNQPAQDLAITHPQSAANSAGGYIRISRENIIHYLHRWLWEELVGPIPIGYEIDHENGTRTDCRLKNLRCIPQAINMRNAAMRSDNTSGVKGVSYWSSGKAWRASFTDYPLGKRKNVTFSVNKYGNDLAFAMACDARADAIAEQNNKGAGYTVRHSV